MERMTFPISRCDRDDKVFPAMEHTVAQTKGCRLVHAHCLDMGSGKLVIYVSCSTKKKLTAVKESIEREIVLLKHHRLAGKRRRR
jgi:hypothetical protein